MTAYAQQMAARRRSFNSNRVDQPSTVKQRDYIRKLAGERGEQGALVVKTIDDSVGAIDMLTKKQASSVIDQLMAMPRDRKAWGAALKPVAEPVTDGIYLHDGKVVKVQKAVHGSGNLYAKVLDTDTGKFEYTPGLIRDLVIGERMTLEQAKEFGHLYGMCCKCGATLTDETSIANGIGPVCAKAF